MNTSLTVGIIPARYASTRFPGKPLILIGGKTMIRRVYEQVSQALEHVVVATDDERIEAEVKSFGGDVCLTSPDHRTGTDRCAEALEIYTRESGMNFSKVINIQGDEPFIHPDQIREILECFNRENTQIATLARVATRREDLFDPNQPKVVVNVNNEALLFSRSPVPYLRNRPEEEWVSGFSYLLHVGMYAFLSDVLLSITRLAPSPLELAESLEQLRWLENGYTIRVGITQHANRGIDTPEDLEESQESRAKSQE